MMHVYLAVTPDKLRAALQYTRSIAHVAYRIGQDGRLTRQNLLRTQGGLMVLSDQGCGPVQAPAMLCRDVWMECANRNFSGMLADFEMPPSPDRVQFLQKLAPILARNGRQLFVPEDYGRDIPQAKVLICTAISGGTLRERLEDARQCFGPRLALDLQRLQMTFPLPCPTGEGTHLTRKELQQLMEEQQPSVFYSTDLCAKYFTHPHEGGARFVLFDDADTLQKKIRVGNELGVSAGFLMYPETEDLLHRLFRQ